MSIEISEDGGNLLNLSEADTRAKLIDPAIHRRSWTEDHIRRKETAGPLSLSVVIRLTMCSRPRSTHAGKSSYLGCRRRYHIYSILNYSNSICPYKLTLILRQNLMYVVTITISYLCRSNAVSCLKKIYND